MFKVIIAMLLSFLAGVTVTSGVAESAAAARDRAIVSNYINQQSQAALHALAVGDDRKGEQHQRNALEAAARGGDALAMNAAAWTFWFPVAAGFVSLFVSDETSDPVVRRQQERSLRLQLATTLERQNRIDEARAQREKAAALQ